MEIVIPQHDIDLYAMGIIRTLNLLAGWDDGKTEKLKDAVGQVVAKNPLLSAMLKKQDDGTVICQAGHHCVLVVEVEGPKDVALPNNTAEAIALLHSIEDLIFEHDPGAFAQALESGGPLFRIALVKLHSGFVALVPFLNHIIADGDTYYKVCESINLAMNGTPLPDLQWRPAGSDVPHPSCYSEEERQFMQTGWLPGFMSKMDSYKPGSDSQRVAVVNEIDSDAIAELKSQYKAAMEDNGIAFLSTNDFIMAGQSELADENTFTNILVNMRGRLPDVGDDLAGNYERSLCLPATKDPLFWRMLQNNWTYFGLEGNPKLTSPGWKEQWEACNFNVVSNWSSLSQFIKPPGTTFLAHCPAKGFVTMPAGIDFAVVFKADETGALMMIDNYTSGKRGQELSGRIEESKIFKRLHKVVST